MAGFFLKASGNSAKVFELAEHAFDDMAFLIQVPVAASLNFSIDLGRNHCHNVTLLMPVEQGIRVITLVGQQRASGNTLNRPGFELTP